jgi:hypothetical protein
MKKNDTPGAELPITVQQQLIEVTDRLLPPELRDQFLARTIERISKLAHEYDNTLVYAAVGWVVGQIIEEIPVIGWVASESTSELGLLIGGLLGFRKDRKQAKKEHELEERMTQIIGEELNHALKRKV